MSVHQCVCLGVVFIYSLIDKNSIIKYYRFNHVVSPMMVSFIFLNKNSTLNILLIQVVKYEKIKINSISCKGCIVSLFDGPGIELEKLNWKNTVVTVSFQCLIYVEVLRENFFEKFSIKNVNYTTILAEIKALHANTNENILMCYPVNTQNVIDILGLVSIGKKQINLTVYNIAYNGVYNPLCLYGGFAVFNEENSVFKETFSSCKSHIHDSRSFYSTNFSLLFILYMYEQYNSVNISCKISTVKHKPVIIDICEVNYYCGRYNWDINKCTGYLNKITRISRIILLAEYGQSIIFSMNKMPCVVIQIIQTIDLKSILDLDIIDHPSVCLN